MSSHTPHYIAVRTTVRTAFWTAALLGAYIIAHIPAALIH